MRRSGQDLPFGLSEREAEGLLRLAASPDWACFAAYLDGFGKVSLEYLRRRNQSAEDQGFYKGQLQLIEDVISFPVELARILRQSPAGEEEEDLPVLE